MATFESLAAKCAASAALDLLVAIASVESGVQPLVLRDGAALTRVASAGEGVALAVGAADQGRAARVGLMGLTERQLRAAGLTLPDGFDGCASLSVAAGIIQSARAMAQGPNTDVADQMAMRAWWRADGRFASVSAFEGAVARERAAASVLAKREIASTSPKRSAPPVLGEADGGGSLPAGGKQHATLSIQPDCWDVFARHRAGVAQCEDPPLAVREPRPRRPEPETASTVIFGSRDTPR
jgi:hypothetical protein